VVGLMTALAWTAIGLLAATLAVLATAVLQLGARVDGLGVSLGARIDALGDTLNVRIDALNARIDGLGNSLNARIDGLSARLDVHTGRHIG